MSLPCSEVVAWISERAPQLELEIETHNQYEIVRLPAASEADYKFLLYVYSDGERGLAASLQAQNDSLYFWTRQLELSEFSDARTLQEEFLRLVSVILESPTRITQKRGVLFHCFRCEAEVEGEWELLGSHAGLRGQFTAPAITGRTFVYRSAPVSKAR